MLFVFGLRPTCFTRNRFSEKQNSKTSCLIATGKKHDLIKYQLFLLTLWWISDVVVVADFHSNSNLLLSSLLKIQTLLNEHLLLQIRTLLKCFGSFEIEVHWFREFLWNQKSQELWMLSRSLSDCKSLLINVMIKDSQFVSNSQMCH